MNSSTGEVGKLVFECAEKLVESKLLSSTCAMTKR